MRQVDVKVERPIIFSGEMVRAILDGRKTQTRRVMKPQPIPIPDDVPHDKGQDWWWSSREFRTMVRLPDEIGCMPCQCPYGQAGDRLWVRETWKIEMNSGFYDIRYKDGKCKDAGVNLYLHSYQHLRNKCYVWRPSIFLPRWASRITLEITEVRVERLHEISEEDAVSEGITGYAYRAKHGDEIYWLEHDQGSHRGAFGALWDTLNAKRSYGWETNPWVWMISFKRVEQ